MVVLDNMAMRESFGHAGDFAVRRRDSSRSSSGDFARLLADVFRRARWRIHRRSSTGDAPPNLIVEGGGRRYLFEVMRAAEGRRDRLIPLLSQAILQARAAAHRFQEGVVPVAVVAAERIPPSVAEQVKQFGAQYAPETGIGIIDAHGLRGFAGHGLEVFDARPSRSANRRAAAPRHLPHLFSDLNQWMLKLMLGQFISESLLAVPRGPFRSATQLAHAAEVSLMSASRFVRQLRNEGFLDDREDDLRLARVEELLDRWVAANQLGPRDIPVRWIVRRDQSHLLAALKAYSAVATRRPRCAVGLFAAADALGFGFVQGVPPHIYLERFDADALRELGLSAEDAGHRADAYVRVPACPEAVFRASVKRDGLPVSDILQVWLDVSRHPTRGQEQADQIRQRVLGPVIGKK